MPRREQSAREQSLNPAMENYLKAIFLIENRDGAARPSAIGDMTKVARSTVSGALNSLKNMGYVEYSPYSLIRLTEQGKVIGRKIVHRHIVLHSFLENILQVDSQEAHAAACELEHMVSEDIVQRFGKFILFLKSREEFWSDWQEVYEKESIQKNFHSSSAMSEILKQELRHIADLPTPNE